MAIAIAYSTQCIRAYQCYTLGPEDGTVSFRCSHSKLVNHKAAVDAMMALPSTDYRLATQWY